MTTKGLFFKFNIAVITILFVLYFGFFAIVFTGQDNQAFKLFLVPGWIEIVSLFIFIFSLFFGNKNLKWYTILLVFNILALPASVDNFLPSVLLSSPIDIKDVYFPMITHIDIYLILGIIRYWVVSKEEYFTIKQSKFSFLFFIGALFMLLISISLNTVRYNNLYDIALILSHSYHIRYTLLLLLLFFNTNIINYKKVILIGITVSVIFLIIESTLFSYIFYSKSRLISGTLRNNTFANIVTAICCYYIFMLIRKKITLKYIVLIIAMVTTIFLTETRSALFVLFIYLFLEFYWYLRKLLKQYKIKRLFYLLGFSFIALIIFFSVIKPNERMTIYNFKINKIDFSKNSIEEIIVLEKNDFNASLILRLQHYQVSLNMIKENPLIGIGSGRWNKSKADYGSTNKQIMDSHNDILAMTSQYGIIAGILFYAGIYFIPLFIYKTNNSKKINNHSEDYLFIISLVMVFAGLTNSGLFKHQVFGFLALIVVTYICSRPLNNKKIRIDEDRNIRN